VKFRTNGANDTSSTVTTTSILKHHNIPVQLEMSVNAIIPSYVLLISTGILDNLQGNLGTAFLIILNCKLGNLVVRM
jgi:hypothetical protein